ncbi:HdeD family acid-resistance protein [Sphingobacterium endophyticum]|uniref:HdeD family acid-resistance protein n=1 Tax=Sphingobacterium endophyticum TaxID=2546448 RepID=UPI001E2F4817|nr:HdeD family acid-resistance protein [Sphingobacterium endophyticum]
MENFLKSVRSAIKQWYLPLIVGIILIILGFYVISTPVTSFLALSFVFSISFLFSGIAEIIFSLNNKNELDGWGWYLTGGILNAIFGILLITHPAISMATLPFIIGFFVMFKSIQYLSLSLELKQYGSKNWGWILFFSILGIIFSFILLWNPVFAGMTIVLWTGIAILSAGMASCILSFQLKSLKNISSRTPEDWKKRYEDLEEEYRRFKSEK